MEYDFLTQTYRDDDGRIGYAEPISYLYNEYLIRTKMQFEREIRQSLHTEAPRERLEIRKKYRAIMPASATPTRDQVRANPLGQGRAPGLAYRGLPLTARYERGPHGQVRGREAIPKFSFR